MVRGVVAAQKKKTKKSGGAEVRVFVFFTHIGHWQSLIKRPSSQSEVCVLYSGLVGARIESSGASEE